MTRQIKGKYGGRAILANLLDTRKAQRNARTEWHYQLAFGDQQQIDQARCAYDLAAMDAMSVQEQWQEFRAWYNAYSRKAKMGDFVQFVKPQE